MKSTKYLKTLKLVMQFYPIKRSFTRLLKEHYFMKKTRKRFPFFDVLLTTLTLLLIVASGYLLFLFNNDPSAKSTKTTDVDDIPSTIDETESNFAGIKIITEIANDMNTPFAIQYPQSNHTAFNDKVKKYIKSLKYDYSLDVTEYKQEYSDLKSELNISFETFKHPNGIYSFIIVNNESINEQKSKSTIRTFHLDPETGEMPTLQDIVAQNGTQLEQLAEHAAEHLNATEQTIEDDLLSSEEVSAYTEPIWENYQEFALTDEMLILYFTQHQSDDYTPIVSIPYENINDLFVDEFQIQQKVDKDKDEEANKNDEDQASGPDSTDEDDKQDEPEKESPPEKKVALTFDDGPDPEVTTRVLEILNKYDAKATFYMLGSRVEYYPEIAKKVQEAGHELGNHSWTHADLTKASNEKVFNEIDRTSQIIEEVTGVKPYSFRPPYGAFNDTVKQQTDLPIVLWDVDTLDWKHRNPQQLLTYAKSQVKNNSVILMHDIHHSTADGLDGLMAYLKEEGYTFVTVSEID